MTNEEAHRLAREKGVSRPLYAAVRATVTPFMRLWAMITSFCGDCLHQM